ncbi:hypothetical protein DYB38_006328 [Aphanomyces astaci]|uniref:CCD97-like C-terminal domain-containing protein n=1 Tax=Aphanomyces astaci TaxID=112090 RepID=A0A397DFP1_APHAT|nr:hypothetical protein DYB38_006328 [Aphanomyces astaci]
MDFRTNLDDDDPAVRLELETHSMRIIDDVEEDPLDAYMKTIAVDDASSHDSAFPRELPRPRREVVSITASVTKNRRYQKLQELLHASDYFSDENMELRHPGLFHLHLGNYLPTPPAPAKPTADQSKLSEFLIASIQKRDLEERKAHEESLWGSSFKRSAKPVAIDDPVEDDEHNHAFQEEMDSDDDGDEEDRLSSDDEAELSVAERRATLVDVMAQRFMHGLDVGFIKYDEIDTNDLLDLNPLALQDLEDEYFTTTTIDDDDDGDSIK